MNHRVIGLGLGPLLFLLVLMLPPFGSFTTSAVSLLGSQASVYEIEQLVFAMQVVFALLLLMVVWWLTEAIPLPATALLPPVVLPWFHLAGVHEGETVGLTFKSILENYASPVIFLFLGTFLLAGAMRKWGLDRRLTYWILTRGRLAGDTRLLLFGVMMLCAFLSMWISNTATTAMMLPIGISIISLVEDGEGKSGFGTALMLGIAWASSVGGVGTIIGSPPNGIAVGILDSTFASDPGYEGISFLDWMMFGVPYVVLFVPIIWFILLRRYSPDRLTLSGGKERLLEEMKQLGNLTAGERWTILVFAMTVLLWISNPFWEDLLPAQVGSRLSGVNEFMIGLFAGLSLFVLPVDLRKPAFVLEWRDTSYVDWGTLILFGGGIALSDALFTTGVASWIATNALSAAGNPSTLILVLIIVLLVDLLTEITSNTAVTTMLVPIMISVAFVLGEDPVTLSIAVAVAASMAFMLPVATPPNALVYSSGKVKLTDMIKTGLILDMLGWGFTVGILWFFGYILFGVLQF